MWVLLAAGLTVVVLLGVVYLLTTNNEAAGRKDYCELVARTRRQADPACPPTTR